MRPNIVVPILVLACGIGLANRVEAQVTWNSVTVHWTTPGDDSLVGLASQFDLRYSTSPITSANFLSATRWVATPTPAASGTQQSTTVSGLTPNTTYHFAIKTADEVPNWAVISNTISRTTAAAPDTIRPAAIANVTLTVLGETSVRMNWNASGDDSLTGTAASYDIRYSTNPITLATWSSATQVTGEPTPGAPGSAQNHTVTGLTRQTAYFFAIRALDEGGQISALSNVPTATTLDQTTPARINDLAVGFVFLGWRSPVALLETNRGAVAPRRRF